MVRNIITWKINSPSNHVVIHVRTTNGQSPNQRGGASTPSDTQGEKILSGVRCSECAVKFESQEELESHIQTDHPEAGPETSAAAKKAEALPAPKVRHHRNTHIWKGMEDD